MAKGKEMGARYAGAQDLGRVFNRALELLNSTSPESDQELLELVKKAKRDMEKEPAPPAKKSRTSAYLLRENFTDSLLIIKLIFCGHG